MQRKRYAPLAEVVQFRGKGPVRQQLAKSPQRVQEGEECEHEPQEFGQESHVGLSCHVSSSRGAPNGGRATAAKNQMTVPNPRLAFADFDVVVNDDGEDHQDPYGEHAHSGNGFCNQARQNRPSTAED
jgi:hypothetical protein